MAGVVVDRFAGDLLIAPFRDWTRSQTAGRLRQRSRRNEERAFGVSGEAVLLGPDQYPVFIHQFAVNGFDPDLITSELITGRPVAELIEQLPDGLRPLRADQVDSLISAERTNLAGSDHYWNGEKLALRNLIAKREPVDEKATFHLGFEQTDYATFRTVGKAWEAHAQGAEALLGDERLRSVVPGLSHSFGVNLTVETDDGYVLMTQRSSRTNGWNGTLHISVNEGMAIGDIDADGRPDPYRTALRGLREELGIEVGGERVKLHALILDVRRYEWAFLGHVDLRGTEWTAARLLAQRALGGAVDDWETTNPIPVRFATENVVSLLGEQRPWVPHGYLNLVLSTVHRFPRDRSRVLAAAIPRVDRHAEEVELNRTPNLT